MSDVIGRGVIEVSGDSSKLNAAINDARRSIKSLGDANVDSSTKSSASIDRYIKRLQVQQAVSGKSAREAELYKLALRGASDEQLRAANSTLRLTEAYQKGILIGDRVRTGLIASAAVAGLAATGLTAMIISSINAADHLNDLSKTTGISVENLSGLALAAKQSGTDLDGVAASISKLSQNIGKDGEKFRALGITAKDPLEAFKQLADVFVAVDDPQTRAALGAAALGKSWQSAAPLLAEGGKSIGEMVAKGIKLSGVTKQMADDADKFNDQLAELKTTASGFGTKIAGEMLPAFTEIIGAVKLAYEESGKLNALWTAMGGLGAFLFTDQFSSATVKIKNLKEELAGLEYLKKNAKNSSAGGGYLQQFLFGNSEADLDKKIKDANAQIAALQDSLKPKVDTAESPAEVARKARAAKDAKDKADAFIKAQQTDAAERAKAQLAFDLDQIKKGSEAVTNAFANAEKIMEARRAANLIDERDYYAAKLGFLNLNSAEQEKELQKEIARLQAEKLTGKEKINNAREIAAAQAKLTKVREAAVANVAVNSIQEEAANRKIAQSYVDATKAAQAYIDTIVRQNAREIEGVGRGTKFRDQQSGRNQIEDKFTDQRQNLERDRRNNQITQAEFETYLAIAEDTYAREIDLYDRRTAALLAKEGDWTNGANEAMANYIDASANAARQSEDLFTNSFKGIEDALVNMAMTGKLSFDDLAKSIIASIIRIQAQAAIAGLLKLFTVGSTASAVSPAATSASVGFLHSGGIVGSEWTGSRTISSFPANAPRYHTGGIAGNEVPAILKRGEGVFTQAQMRSLAPVEGSGGKGAVINFNPVYNLQGGIDPATRAEMQKIAKQQSAVLVDQLQRAGALG